MDISKIDQSVEQMYSGDLDIIVQIIYELKYFPESSLSTNLRSWYNSLYSDSVTMSQSYSSPSIVEAGTPPELSTILKSAPLLVNEKAISQYLSAELKMLAITLPKAEYQRLTERLKKVIK